MYEVELKFPADHETLRERLTEVGATARGTVVQRDTYYDAPHREFATTDEALRIRRVERDEGVESRITYKGPLVDDASKTRREHETGVDDDGSLAAALEALGFEPAATVTKRRESFSLDGVTVTLDDVEEAGQFVELEADGDVPESAVDRVRETVTETARSLGLDPDESVQTSYLEMVLAPTDEQK